VLGFVVALMPGLRPGLALAVRLVFCRAAGQAG
jgi:hypothetical protein